MDIVTIWKGLYKKDRSRGSLDYLTSAVAEGSGGTGGRDGGVLGTVIPPGTNPPHRTARPPNHRSTEGHHRSSGIRGRGGGGIAPAVAVVPRCTHSGGCGERLSVAEVPPCARETLVDGDEAQSGTVGAGATSGPRAGTCGTIIPGGADKGERGVQGTVSACHAQRAEGRVGGSVGGVISTRGARQRSVARGLGGTVVPWSTETRGRGGGGDGVLARGGNRAVGQRGETSVGAVPTGGTGGGGGGGRGTIIPLGASVSGEIWGSDHAGRTQSARKAPPRGIPVVRPYHSPRKHGDIGGGGGAAVPPGRALHTAALGGGGVAAHAAGDGGGATEGAAGPCGADDAGGEGGAGACGGGAVDRTVAACGAGEGRGGGGHAVGARRTCRALGYIEKSSKMVEGGRGGRTGSVSSGR